jgi:hypothetical protein
VNGVPVHRGVYRQSMPTRTPTYLCLPSNPDLSSNAAM